MSVEAGQRVEVTGMSGRLLAGVVDRVDGSLVYVVPDGKAKARPFEAARVRAEGSKRSSIASALLRAPAAPHSAPPAPSVKRSTQPEFRGSIPKPAPPARSTSYMDFVRHHQCCMCRGRERTRIEAHHWQDRRGVGQKVSDYRTVPLCNACHRTFHETGAIAPLDARTTRELFLTSQVALLEEWIREKGVAA